MRNAKCQRPYAPGGRRGHRHDAEMAARLLHLFTALNRLGTTIVVATHDVGLIARTPGAQLIRLEKGSLTDPTGSLRNPPLGTAQAR